MEVEAIKAFMDMMNIAGAIALFLVVCLIVWGGKK